jgi:hypothetical protein
MTMINVIHLIEITLELKENVVLDNTQNLLMFLILQHNGTLKSNIGHLLLTQMEKSASILSFPLQITQCFTQAL